MSHERESTSVTCTTPRRICVIGAGYVGLTAAACLAQLGHRVTCVESDPRRLGMIRRGEMPIYEPGLGEMVLEQGSRGNLDFTDSVEAGVRDAELSLLCVGTPPRPSGQPDLSQLARAAQQVARAVSTDTVLVIKSTVPPGTCEAIELLCAEVAAPGVHVRVASSPEFLRESRAVEDFFAPDRVVVGAEEDDVASLVASIYPSGAPVVRCDRRGAELVKYAANTFLALKISFANEVAQMCDALGTDATRVLDGVGADARVGRAFLGAGPGYGGSCLPKDVAGFIALGDSVGTRTSLAEAAQEQNARSRAGVVARLEMVLGSLRGRHVTVLGVAFKAGTDDTRESPGLDILERLDAAGAIVAWHDPLVRDGVTSARRERDLASAIRGAEAIVITTGAEEYAGLSSVEVAATMEGSVVFDVAGVCDLDEWTGAGLTLYGVGRGAPLGFYPVVWTPLRWTGSSPEAVPA